MTEEEALFTEVDNILKDANDQEVERYKQYVKTVATTVEQTLHDEYGVEETYKLFTLNMAHKGTPESIQEFKSKATEKEPNVVSLTVQDDQDTINACLEMEVAFVAQEGMPPDINGLLGEKQAMLLCHAKRENLVGFVVRTGGWASRSAKDNDIRPSEADDRMSITMTIYYVANLMIVIPRDDETGALMEDGIQTIDVFNPSADVKDKYEGLSNGEVAEMCAKWLDNAHGRTAAAIYRAFAFPKALMFDDLEMYKAITKDALLAAASKETEQE